MDFEGIIHKAPVKKELHPSIQCTIANNSLLILEVNRVSAKHVHGANVCAELYHYKLIFAGYLRFIHGSLSDSRDGRVSAISRKGALDHSLALFTITRECPPGMGN